MKTFIIIPIKGNITAPGIAITVKKGDKAYYNAIAEAKKLSRLSDFPEWSFM